MLETRTEILRGVEPPVHDADVHIVIDVLRAFTVAHEALSEGARCVVLLSDLAEGLRLRSVDPTALLVGERGGRRAPGFDCGNSVVELRAHRLASRTVGQMTTNGTAALLNALGARHVLACGYVNARVTAAWVRGLVEQGEVRSVNLIASHPSDDDDLACAELIRDLIGGADEPDAARSTVDRIRGSDGADKFHDPRRPEFDPEDLTAAVREVADALVLKADGTDVTTLRAIR